MDPESRSRAADGSGGGRTAGSGGGRPGGATVEAFVRALDILREEIDAELTVQVAMTFFGVAASEGVGVRELAERLEARESAVSRNVGLLAEYGRRGKAGAKVVEIRFDRHDRRAKPLYLTPKGERVLRKALAPLGR